MSNIVNGIEITHPALVDYNAKVQAIFSNLKNPLYTPAQKLSELEKVKVTLSTIKDSFVKAKESTNDITITQQLDALIEFINTEYTDYVSSFVSGDNIVSAIDTSADETIIVVDGGSVDMVEATPTPLPVHMPKTELSSDLDLGVVMTEVPEQTVSNSTTEFSTEVPEKFLDRETQMPDVDSDVKEATLKRFKEDNVPSTFHNETKSTDKLYAVLEGQLIEVGDMNEFKEEIKKSKTPFSEIKLISGREIKIDITFNI